MKTMTPPTGPFPTDSAEIVGHLVAVHGWEPVPFDPTMVQAHRFAHGVDGRPDLADEHLGHTHSASTRRNVPLTPRWAGIILAAVLVVGGAAFFHGSDAAKPLSQNAQVYAVSINNETTCAGITALRGEFADQQAAAMKGMNANIDAGGDGGVGYETASDLASIAPLIDSRVNALCRAN